MLVEALAQSVTTIRGIVRAHGERLPSCGTESFLERVAQTPLAPELRELIAPAIAVLRELVLQVRTTDLKLVQLCEREPAIRQLCTAPGVGVVVAAAFVSVIDDARRFDNAHKVQAYLGLVPNEKSTGGRQRLGAITKMGNSYLRSLLVQAASTVLRLRRPGDPLIQWAQMVAARRGKRIAMVALARRLAGVLWAMWRRDTVYEPARVGAASAGDERCWTDRRRARRHACPGGQEDCRTSARRLRAGVERHEGSERLDKETCPRLERDSTEHQNGSG